MTLLISKNSIFSQPILLQIVVWFCIKKLEKPNTRSLFPESNRNSMNFLKMLKQYLLLHCKIIVNTCLFCITRIALIDSTCLPN